MQWKILGRQTETIHVTGKLTLFLKNKHMIKHYKVHSHVNIKNVELARSVGLFPVPRTSGLYLSSLTGRESFELEARPDFCHPRISTQQFVLPSLSPKISLDLNKSFSPGRSLVP